mgnify:CR=1 FL=1|tara:strand:+ start:1523 stop:1789 length:267 start_codon:yes stop_codon:yes gene_type:complete
MRTIHFKKIDGTYEIFNSSNESLILNQEQPFGVDYKGSSTTTLSESELNMWWGYVDSLIIESSINNFQSVWKIVDSNNITYGYTNDPQ